MAGVEDFEKIRELGRGGQGVTWLARERASGRLVALKIVHFGLIDDLKVVELFEREVATLSRLDHEAIPTFVAALEHIDPERGLDLYLAQEYIEGQTLQAWMADGGRLDEDSARALLGEVLDILDYLHGLDPPVIHRDVKPANIIRRPDGRLALVDFGAVKMLRAETQTSSSIIGTTGYVPPEQFLGRAQPASDLYALAATMVHVLSHRHPMELEVEGLRLVFRDVVHCSEELIEVLEAMLEPDVLDRLKTVGQVRGMLRGVLRPTQSVVVATERAPIRVARGLLYGGRFDALRHRAMLTNLLYASASSGSVAFWMALAAAFPMQPVRLLAGLMATGTPLVVPAVRRFFWDHMGWFVFYWIPVLIAALYATGLGKVVLVAGAIVFLLLVLFAPAYQAMADEDNLFRGSPLRLQAREPAERFVAVDPTQES